MKVELSEDPIDGHTIEFWRCVSGVGLPVRMRTIYYANTAWSDHPWCDGNERGAPFIDQWANEQFHAGRFVAVGRSEGWKYQEHWLAQPTNFPTEREALDFMIARQDNTSIRLQGELAESQAATLILVNRLLKLPTTEPAP